MRLEQMGAVAWLFFIVALMLTVGTVIGLLGRDRGDRGGDE